MTQSHQRVRRALLCLCALAPLAALSQVNHYPSRPVTIVVPYAPGGATDVVARVLANSLGKGTKGTFIVDNKPGGSGTIAMGTVAKSAPDGYTLLLNEITSTVVGELIPTLSFDSKKAFTPIAIMAETPYVLVVNDKLPVKSLQELLTYAKANPGKLSYGSGGVGSGPHIAGELFKSLAKIEVTHIPYRGSGPALQDLIGGQIQILITAAPTVASMAGKLRPLVVANNKRLSILPDVPSAPEAGMPDFIISNWFGLAAPKGTPEAVIKALSSNISEVVKNPDVIEKILAAGAKPVFVGPVDAARKVSTETEKWGALIKKAGIKNDN